MGLIPRFFMRNMLYIDVCGQLPMRSLLRSTCAGCVSPTIDIIHVCRLVNSRKQDVNLAGNNFLGVHQNCNPDYRSLLASRSDSSKVRRSPSRTGPLTFLMICRFCSPRNSTFTCVHCPCEPVRPRTLMTRAKTTGLSMIIAFRVNTL